MSNQFEPSVDEPSREQGTPLTDFWGTGAGWGVKNAGKTDYKIMVYRFAGPGFKVVSSSIPYAFESAEIEIFYQDPKMQFKRQANKGISEWLAFSDSIREMYPELNATQMFDDAFGGRVELAPEGQVPSKPGRLMHWAKVPTLMSAKDPTDESGKKYTDQMLGAWKVVEIDGIGSIGISGVSGGTASVYNGNGALEIMSYALDLANGLTEVDFYAKAMDDMKLVNNPGITKQLTDRAWIQQMISMGQLKNVDGVLVRA